MYSELGKTSLTKIEKFRELVAKQRFGATIPLQANYAQSATMVPYADRRTLDFQPISEGQSWGKTREMAWFQLSTEIPSGWLNLPVVARIQLSSELLLWNDHGETLFALTNSSVWDKGFVKDRYVFTPSAPKLELWAEAHCIGGIELEVSIVAATLEDEIYGTFKGRVEDLKLSLWREDVHALWVDVEVLLQLLLALPEASVRRQRILRALTQAINVYAENPANANAARALTQPLLNNGAENSSLTAYTIGHAHLDTGWLWPVKASVGKIARTFAYQVAMMEKYPDYVFGASQPQHFKFVQDCYPELFAKVKHFVARGQFELQGAMWVEADCNLISGESMIRQILYGKAYFKREFGIDVTNLWLPDVFGYSANLPQILKKSNVNYFMTQKISWNQYNIFPHHTFVWQGIDGSEIISHFLPANTYNGYVKPSELIEGEKRYAENGELDGFLYLFGIGDGGGGPSEEHIEFAQRLQNTEGCPRVKLSAAQDFFTTLDQHEPQLERWVGELYLELHRGTLTSQAQIKKDNRRWEQRLQALEAASSSLPAGRYPHQLIGEIYPLILINQFHDIIPGSSIHEVYQEAAADYATAATLAAQIESLLQEELTLPKVGTLLVYNSLSFGGSRYLELAREMSEQQFQLNGLPLVSQRLNQSTLLELPQGTEPYSWLSLTYQAGTSAVAETTVSAELILENDLVRYEFAPSGEIIRAYDKEQQWSFLADANRLSLYIDQPDYWDAWDIDYDYQERCLIRLSAANFSYHSGEIANRLVFNYAFSQSQLEQEIILARGSKQLRFKNRALWQEEHKMLRVAFPTTIANPRANFDIQYGYVERPTHRNTSWDLARFESVAHKYVDLANADHGVALLNDCKYGHAVLNSTIDLNLLRSPTKPDPLADRGWHEFSYAIYPHRNDLANSNVYQVAKHFNQTALCFVDRQLKNPAAGELPFRLTSATGVSLEVVKRAEDGSGWILRAVEYRGRNGRLDLSFNCSYAVVETNLIEEAIGQVALAESWQRSFQPFEIVTLKIS